MKTRIEYLDAMRGFCMLLVVYSHLGASINLPSIFCNDVFQSFNLPLFFFLSGFLSFSVSAPPYLFVKVKKRLLGQLLPTVVLGFVFVTLMCGGDYEWALYHKSKAGYWFTIVAFEIYIIYSLITYLLDEFSFSIKTKAIVYCVAAIAALPLSFVMGKTGFNNTPVSGLFSLVSVVSYIPFFLFGVITKMYNEKFTKIVENSWAISIVIVAFAILQVVGKIYGVQIKLVFYGVAGIMLLYMIFHNFRDFFSCRTMIGKSLSYIGKRTLPIYLTHYFLLSGVAPQIVTPVIQNNCGWIVGFICYTTLSLVIIGVCLLIEALFRKAEPLYRICFGYPN